MRDMTPRGDKSIRNIPVPSGHRLVRSNEAPLSQTEFEETDQPMYEEDFSNPPPRRSQRNSGFFGSRIFWILVAVVVIFATIGILMSTMFAGATITVTPRSAIVTAPASLEAAANAPAGTLMYHVITTNRTASTSVPATGTKQVSVAASGMVTIYNAYSSAKQDLVATTRFEAPDGKIYRIHSNVTVPGATGSGSSLTPGTVEATVYADKPGAEYNRADATQFTIPGFKGDPKYTKFYAKSTGAIGGGLVGSQPGVSATDLATAQQALRQGLSGAMDAMMSSQVPKEYMAVPGTLNVTYNDIVQTPGPNGTAILSQTANASADVIASQDLASAVAKQTVQGYAGEAVNFADPSGISISLAASSSANGIISLKLSGSPKLVWQFDPNALAQALLGKPKSQFETILKSFAPAITCSSDTPCKASVRPFWSGSFPSSSDKISVETGS